MRDPGLQPERTSLAWWRSMMAVSVADALLLRSWLLSLAPHTATLKLTMTAIAALIAGLATAVIIWCAWKRKTQLRAPAAAGSSSQSAREALAAPAWLPLALTLAVLAMALSAMLSVVS